MTYQISYYRKRLCFLTSDVNFFLLTIENHTVELTGLASSLEFDNFFASVVESQRKCHLMTKNSVIVHDINTGLFQ